jgi:hypothetical protein
MKPAKKQYGYVDVVVVVAAVCLAVIVMGLVFPASRRFAMTFGWIIFLVLVAVGIGVLAYVGWILMRYALGRRQDTARPVEPEVPERTEA